MNDVVILAGAEGARVSVAVLGQFFRFFDKPVLAKTPEIFEHDENNGAIEVVSHKDWVDKICQIVKDCGTSRTFRMRQARKLSLSLRVCALFLIRYFLEDCCDF